MNQKNSLNLDISFGEHDNPLNLFKEWFREAKKREQNDPNAFALATSNKKGVPSVRMVLMKDFSKNGFVFYTNLNSEKSQKLKTNPIASMCFHWKSLLRQIRIFGKVSLVSNKTANKYFISRKYESKIGAWSSNQSAILKNRKDLIFLIENFKKKYPNSKKVPRPTYWSGWNLKPISIEFWLQGNNRIHQRLKYIKKQNGRWKKTILYP